MGKWVPDRLLVAVGLVLVGATAVWAAWIQFLPPAERSAAIGYGQFVVALAGAVLAALGGLRHVRHPADPRPVDTLAGLLAQAVLGQWRTAASERGLFAPAPIPLRWSLSPLQVTGPVAAAVGAPDVAPVFPPLPGLITITVEKLQAGGGLCELHDVYAGVASGRVVIIGAPGAGKSGAAVLLLLDALEHRNRVEDKDQARLPVPVLLTVHGWDPTICSAQDWLAGRLATDYPLFQHRGGNVEAAALVAAGAVALILDGLDEIPKELRPAALQSLSNVPFRVIVLTRSQEMVQAAGDAWLVGAVAVQLHNVAGREAADYLQRASKGRSPSGWTQLLTQLREHPKGVLAQGLSTPLSLTLIRDTYREDDDVSDLLDPIRYPSSDDIKQHLIARILPAAYTPQPDKPLPRYDLSQAHQVLAFIARQMSQDVITRDFAWWHIPRWAPATPRVLSSGLVAGLVFAFVGWLVGGFVFGAIFGLVVGLVVGIGGGKPRRVRAVTWRAFSSRPVLVYGLVYGLVGWIMGGFVVGLVDGFMVGLREGLREGLRDGIVGGIVGGLVVGLMVGLVGGLVLGLAEADRGEGNPQSPREIWRNDRMLGLVVGLVVGLVGGLGTGVGGGLGDELGIEGGLGEGLGGLVDGLVVGLVVGTVVGLMSSETWPVTLAWLQLQRSRKVPAIGLMPFLEDAQARGVLRTVGAVYQFRHATLQDHLAKTTSNTAAARSF